MKRFVGVVAVAACLSLGVVDEAKAGGPFCITFTDFCDQITIRTTTAGGRTWIHGTWDWTCVGDLTLIHGVNDGFAFGTQPVAGGVPAGGSATFKIFAGATLFDLAATFDAVSNTVLQDNQSVAAIVAGSCPGHPINAGQPRLLGSR